MLCQDLKARGFLSFGLVVSEAGRLLEILPLEESDSDTLPESRLAHPSSALAAGIGTEVRSRDGSAGYKSVA